MGKWRTTRREDSFPASLEKGWCRRSMLTSSGKASWNLAHLMERVHSGCLISPLHGSSMRVVYVAVCTRWISFSTHKNNNKVSYRACFPERKNSLHQHIAFLFLFLMPPECSQNVPLPSKCPRYMYYPNYRRFGLIQMLNVVDIQLFICCNYS